MYVHWFSSTDDLDPAIAGHKAVRLQKMRKLNLPVSEGFVISTSAFDAFLNSAKLLPVIDSALSQANLADPINLYDTSTSLKQRLAKSVIPENVAFELLEAYLKFQKSLPKKGILGKIRGENSPGSQILLDAEDNQIIVDGEANFLEAVKSIWLSSFDPRQLRAGYRLSVGPIIVKAARKIGLSGKIYSSHPQRRHTYLLDTPQAGYEIAKSNLEISFQQITNRAPGLSKVQLKQLVGYADALEKFFFFPQEIDFQISDGEILIEGSREVAVFPSSRPLVSEPPSSPKPTAAKPREPDFYQGVPLSPGRRRAPLHVVNSPGDLNHIHHGDIAFIPDASPAYSPLIKKASGLIIRHHTLHSPLIDAARHKGIPAVSAVNFNPVRHLTVSINGSDGSVRL